jgi:hypothetical protein
LESQVLVGPEQESLVSEEPELLADLDRVEADADRRTTSELGRREELLRSPARPDQPGHAAMKPLGQLSPFCLVLALVLILALTANVVASPGPVDSPLPQTQDSAPLLAITANRANVVRIAALGMALALFIMYRSKH